MKDKETPTTSSSKNMRPSGDSGLNQKVEKRVEESLVQLLEKECKELGENLEKEKVQSQELRLQGYKMRTAIDNYEKVEECSIYANR